MKQKTFFSLISFLLFLFAIDANAQKIPVGIRVEAAEVETTNSAYSIFTYKDSEDDNSFGYYLGLGREFHISELTETEDVIGTLDHIDETCICLGSTSAEAFATLDAILDLFDKDVDTSVTFRGRAATGSNRLGEPTTTTCVVTKKPIVGKRLLFLFVSGKHQAGTYLSKTVVKELRAEFKIDRKLHPKQHR